MHERSETRQDVTDYVEARFDAAGRGDIAGFSVPGSPASEKGQHRMNFSEALQAVKSGSKISRSGWNGKDMYVVYQPGYPEGIGINLNTARATGIPLGTVCKFLPYLMFRTAQGDFVPWLASQADLLADDWQIAP